MDRKHFSPICTCYYSVISNGRNAKYSAAISCKNKLHTHTPKLINIFSLLSYFVMLFFYLDNLVVVMKQYATIISCSYSVVVTLTNSILSMSISSI